MNSTRPRPSGCSPEWRSSSWRSSGHPSCSVGPKPKRGGVGYEDVGARVQQVVSETQLVAVAQIVVQPREEPGRRNLEIVPLIGAGDVVEVGLEIGAQRVQVRCEDPRHATSHGLGAVVGLERGARRGLAIVLEAAEEEQAVLNARSAERDADIVILESARVEGGRARAGAAA